MITHIVMWNFQEQLSEAEKKEVGQVMKERLEALKDRIPGVVSLKVIINELPGSDKDIALIGEYETLEDLNHYAVHPCHLEVVDYVKKVACNRTCLDYESL